MPHYLCDRRNVSITFQHDALDRHTGIVYGTESTVKYFYDIVGRVTNVNDSVAGNIGFTYDSLDRLTQELNNLGTVNPSYNDVGLRTNMTVAGDPPVHYFYDDAGNRTNLLVAQTSPPVNILNTAYTYDTRNRVKTIAGNPTPSDPAGLRTTTYNYDEASRLIAATLPNTITLTNTYDNADQLLSMVHKQSSGAIIASFNYLYDLSGNRTNVLQAGGSGSGPTAYTYDARHWLTSATYLDGRLQQFLYDKVGNRTNLLDIVGAITNKTTYYYNAANRLYSIARIGQVQSLSYDGAGRLTNQVINSRTRHLQP